MTKQALAAHFSLNLMGYAETHASARCPRLKKNSFGVVIVWMCQLESESLPSLFGLLSGGGDDLWMSGIGLCRHQSSTKPVRKIRRRCKNERTRERITSMLRGSQLLSGGVHPRVNK